MNQAPILNSIVIIFLKDFACHMQHLHHETELTQRKTMLSEKRINPRNPRLRVKVIHRKQEFRDSSVVMPSISTEELAAFKRTDQCRL